MPKRRPPRLEPRRIRSHEPDQTEQAHWHQETADVAPLELPERMQPPLPEPRPCLRNEEAAVFLAPPDNTVTSSTPPNGLDPRIMRRIRQGRITIERRLDLHDLRQDEAYRELVRFIETSYRQQVRMVLVITGKGSVSSGGVLRQCLPLWCASPPLASMISAITPAHRQHGGDGACYIRLRRVTDGQND